MGTLAWLQDVGLDTASTGEALTRPDLRQIATFFSGILFTASLSYFLHSPILDSILSRFLRRGDRVSSASIDARQETVSNASTSMSNHFDPLALVFVLDIVYVTTAATQFGSLLSFSTATGVVPCTFLVAWSALGEPMSRYNWTGPIRKLLTLDPARQGSETVRLIGLLKLSIHLRERGASQWEKYILWGALTLSTIVMFLTAAVNTGVRRPIPQWDSLSFCYTRHFIVGAAVTRGLNLVIELFILARFISLLFPLIPALNSKLPVASDIQIYRSLSLIALDGATIYPSLYSTSLLADFIPFSAASILVLMAFNHKTLPKQSLITSMLNANQPALPQSIRIPTPSFSPFLNMEPPISPSKERSLVEFNLDTESIRIFDVEKGIPHPFADASITSPHQRPRELRQQWRVPSQVTGSGVEHSGSVTDNKQEAIIATASRTQLYPAENPVFLTTGTLHTQSPRNETPAMRRSRAGQDGSLQRSFLPALKIRLDGSEVPPTLHLRGPHLPSKDTRLGRQILARQAEVADQMLATPRPVHPEHRPLGSLSIAASHDSIASSTPPAPPRTQRAIREDAYPMLILSENHNNPGETSPSTTESGVVFGSDILIRSRDNIMRIRGEVVEGSGESREASAGHGSRRRSSGSFGDQRTLSFRIVSPSQQSFGTSTGEGHGSLAGDSTRPHTGISHAQTSMDALPVVHEGTPSPARIGESHTSRKARNALRGPTFGVGESLLDRFQRGFAFSDTFSSPIAEHSLSPGLDMRGERSRLSRRVPGLRLRSSTVNSGPSARKKQGTSQKRPFT